MTRSQPRWSLRGWLRCSAVQQSVIWLDRLKLEPTSVQRLELIRQVLRVCEKHFAWGRRGGNQG